MVHASRARISRLGDVTHKPPPAESQAEHVLIKKKDLVAID